MSDSVWRLGQQTRHVQSVRSDARGLWNDSAATHIDQRFLRPHQESASRMVAELEAQLASAEKSADHVEQAKEFGVAANRQVAIAGEAIAESQRSQASTYEYAQQAWQHEHEAAQLEALALSLAEQATGACSGCASHRGDAGAAVRVALQPAPAVASVLAGVIGEEMTDEEAQALGYYTGNGYRMMNPTLRSGTLDQVERVAPTLAKAMAALKKAPVHQGWVFRGTSLTAEQLARYQVGARIIEPHFTSSSSSFAIAEEFRGSGNVQMQIYSASGRSVHGVTAFARENEVLFNYASTFEVLSVRTNGSMTQITLREIP